MTPPLHVRLADRLSGGLITSLRAQIDTLRAEVDARPDTVCRIALGSLLARPEVRAVLSSSVVEYHLAVYDRAAQPAPGTVATAEVVS